MDAARRFNAHFRDLDINEQLAYILKEKNLVRLCARTLYDILVERRSLLSDIL